MITKQELEKLKELAKAATPGSWNYDSGNCEVETLKERRHVAIVSNDNITQHEDHLRPVDWECDGYYIAAANPATVLRLIEALEVATEALKRHYMIECIYCVGDGITEEAPDFQNAYGEHGLHTKECLLCRPAKEALNKIYG